GDAAVVEWRRTGWLPVYHYGKNKQSRVHYGLLEEAEQYEDYPAVTQPTLIFHGRDDDVVPCEYSGEFAARNPATTLRVMESGHDLLNVLEEMWTGASQFLRAA